MPVRRSTLAAAFLLVIGAAAVGCASGGREIGDSGRGGVDVGLRDAGPDVGAVDASADVGGDANKPDGGMDGGGLDAGPVCVDDDHDGFGTACTGGPDCDDTNPNVSPAGTEVCNGTDDDCDGTADDGLDVPVFCGVGACRTSVPQCAGGTTSTCTPLAAHTELCNGMDDNCDGQTDEGFGGTTCGIGACQVTVAACSGGSPPPCVPLGPTAEVCNGIDDDCNTAVDDGLGMISCGMGACRRSVPACSLGVPGTCVPGMPGSESCNGLDDNCDGVIDDGFGAITCGTGACQVTVASCVMGTPMSCTPGTPTGETCNGRDDDCNGMVDDGLGNLSCGVGYCLRTPAACVSGAVQTCTPGTPMPSEMCGNGIDDNCNGSIDEGCVTCTPPGNTACGSATGYSVGSTVMGDNTCSAPDVGATCGNAGAGNDTTWVFSSDGSPTRYTITMTGPAGYDAVLHAHSSSACTGADELACDDDSGGVNVSILQLDSPPSGSIYLVTDSFSPSSASTYTLTSSTSGLNNDTCSSPIVIRANGTYTGNTSTRSHQYVPSCDGSFLGNTAPDVVYSITARTSGSITATTCGSGFDTVLAVDTSCGSSSTACSDDFCGLQSSVTFATSAGTTYYIVVDGYGSASGAYTLNITGY